VLDLIDDEDQVGFGLVDDFLGCLGDGRAGGRAQLRNREAEREAGDADIQALETLKASA